MKFFSYRNPLDYGSGEIEAFENFDSCYWKKVLRIKYYTSTYILFDVEFSGKFNDVGFGFVQYYRQADTQRALKELQVAV